MKHTHLFIGFTLAFGAFAACSSSDSNTTGAGSTGGVDTGCIGEPFACPAGQTCWASRKPDFFECLKSGPGKVGDSCTNTYDFAACGDGLTCFAVPGFPEVCTKFCDMTTHGCDDGQKCQGLEDKASGATFYACAPKQGAGGGGTGGSGGTSSASSVAASSVAASSAGPSSSSAASASASGTGGASSSSGGAGGTGG